MVSSVSDLARRALFQVVLSSENPATSSSFFVIPKERKNSVDLLSPFTMTKDADFRRPWTFAATQRCTIGL